MDVLIRDANIAIRAKRPPDQIGKQLITVFQEGSFLQLTFQSRGCRFNAGGSCSMCNYGYGQAPDEVSIADELKQILQRAIEDHVETILLVASGSFLDEREIPEPLQDYICIEVFKTGIPQIIIETHYKSISEVALHRISRLLTGRKIELEIGLETTDPWIQEHILNKNIDAIELETMIAIAHHFHMSVTTNLLLGIPFFSERAQLDSTKTSIRWALSKKADYIIVFPINIHPYTLFEWLYQNECVQVPSLWLAVYLLSELDDFELDHVSMAWYGNRSMDYGKGRRSIPPKTCKTCQNILLEFFEEFYENRKLIHRKQKLADLLRMPLLCNCRETVLQAISASPQFLEAQYQDARSKMKGLIKGHECT